jgi:hypothetical protein
VVTPDGDVERGVDGVETLCLQAFDVGKPDAAGGGEKPWHVSHYHLDGEVMMHKAEELLDCYDDKD